MINVLKTASVICLKGAARLVELGAWTMLNQITGRQMKDRGEALYRDVKDGADHYGRKLKIIKND